MIRNDFLNGNDLFQNSLSTLATKVTIVLLGSYSFVVSAACSPPPIAPPARVTVTAGTTVNCFGTLPLPGPYWVGENNITFNFAGNITSNSYRGLVSIDSAGSGNTSWTANNIRIVNRGTLNSNNIFGINFGYGDQNNYTNGNFHLANYGQIHGNHFWSPYTVIMWSPNGTARIDNHSSAVISSSGNYGLAVYQFQRGEVNNHHNAIIRANGAVGAYGITFSGPAGWVAGSGYAPDYLSSGYTESRSFTLNNDGQIIASVSNVSGAEAFAVFTGYAEQSTINNFASGTIRASATGSSVAHAIYYDNYSNQSADIRSPLSPYIINNSGLIESVATSGTSSAIRVFGKSFNGIPNAGAAVSASNPQVVVNNNDRGSIIGQIVLGDGADSINLNNGSSMIGNIDTAGGVDTLTITGNASLTVTDTYDGGGNAIIGDEIHSGTAWDDRLVFHNFNALLPQLRNWEFIDLHANTSVVLPDNTEAGRVTIDTSSTLILPNLHTLDTDTVNYGSVSLQNAALTTATIDGNYSGTGRIKVDTDFALRQSDQLTITGDVDGNSFLEFNTLNPTATAVGTDIVVIKAPNNNGSGDFHIATSQQYAGQSKKGQFTGMPFIWQLVNDAGKKNWALRGTDEVAAEVPAYAGLPPMGREIVLGDLERLHTRLGELRNHQDKIQFLDQPLSAWSRVYGSVFDYGLRDKSFAMNGDHHGIQFGFDRHLSGSSDWDNFSGLFIGYGSGRYQTSGLGAKHSAVFGSDNTIKRWSVGAYSTFFNQSGAYVDLVAQYGQAEARINTIGKNLVIDGKDFSLSAEIAKSITMNNHWVIEPQIQIKAANVQWKDFYDGVNSVAIKDHTYLTGRVGIRAEKVIETSQGEVKPWLYVGAIHEFSESPAIQYAGHTFHSPHLTTAGELKIGFTADLNNNSQIYGDLGVTSNFGHYINAVGHFGLRIHW